MRTSRGSQFVAAVALVAIASGCGGSGAKSTTPQPSPKPVRAISADELFAQSCKQFRGDAAMDAIFNGIDQDGIKRINAALDLAKQAADADEEKYGNYAATFQTFAEGMGLLVAISNDPNSDYDDMMSAVDKIDFPASKPECPPDSGGLPLPSDSSRG